jgi:formamidopyrimidine-DNA glycosylase
VPELPDVLLYVEHLDRILTGNRLERIRVMSPFVLQTVVPPIQEAAEKRVLAVGRIGKRIVWKLEDDLFLVFHLMIAGRFHLKDPGAAIPRRNVLAAFAIPAGILLFTEASTKKRATLHVVRGREALRDFDRGGLPVLEADLESFEERLREENHTLKRALSDPTLFDGIGNAYSDEILHAAKLSPLKLTRRLTENEVEQLYDATRTTLKFWIEELRREAKGRFPEKVTAFRPKMAVHGKYGKPCPVCGSPVQRIVYAENECNYCARCQTGGKLLADRALSRLLKRDWPRTLDDLEMKTPDRGTSVVSKAASIPPEKPKPRRAVKRFRVNSVKVKKGSSPP